MKPMKLMKMNAALQQFQNHHPKFAKFVQEVPKKTLKEGTVIEISLTTADGQNYCSNMKISADDMALFEELKDL